MIFFMTYKFTESAKNVIKYANEITLKLGHSFIGTEHILYGLAKESEGIASKVLEKQNVNFENILMQIEDIMGSTKTKAKKILGFTPRTKKVLENASDDAKKAGSDYIGTEHILVGIIKEGDSVAIRILLNLNSSLKEIYEDIIKIMNENLSEENKIKTKITKSETSFSQTPTLNQYGKDLCDNAKKGLLDPIIGRKEEIERVIQILTRRTKNNPCLIGEPGVGKTAIVEGLASKIVLGEVPQMLKDKRVVNLDISSMVAGAKYRGDFEDRIKKTLNEVKKVKDVILFIDEIHTIVGAGSAEGAIDAANILKPILARGEISVIGATTIDEYRKYIEKDTALERRFSPVTIEEPSIKDTITMLQGIRDKYENHHNVKITDEAINAAVNFSVRYISDRFLPDKAIDVIDEAASNVRMIKYTRPDKLKVLEKSIEKLKQEKEEAVYSQDFERAAEIRDREEKEQKKYEKEKEKWNNENVKAVTVITEENIAEVIAKWTNVPVKKITQDENARLKNLEEELHKRVIGQNQAIEAVSKCIRRGRVGVKDPDRPIGSFLFLGPTGVGKTETSKALAEVLFGTEDSIIRLDMSEYMEAHATSKLIGSPPGYVGYDEGGHLTKKVRQKPYSIVLFDEIEKAHPDVLNILLQILEDSRLTDNTGRVVSFKNTVIIMTSNVGAKLITDSKKLGFSSGSENEEKISYENTKKDIMQEVKREFRPEFINRIDEIIVFHKLGEKDLKNILDLLIANLLKRLETQGILVEVDDSVKDFILKQDDDKNYGARPLRRIMQSVIEDNITDAIIERNFKNKCQKDHARKARQDCV